MTTMKQISISQRDSCAVYQLKERMDELIANATAPLNLSPTQFFPTLQDIAAHLRVAATQRSFALHSYFKTQQMRFICTRGYGTSYKAGYGTCRAYWEIREYEDENGSSWKVVQANLKHDHKIVHFEVEGEGSDIGDVSNSEDEVDKRFNLDGKSATSTQALPIASPKREIKPISRMKPDGRRKHQTQVSTLLEFRTHGSIRNEIQHIMATGHLAFPTVANKIAFASYDQFRIYASAAALQDDFRLYLQNTSKGGANKETFFMRCFRYHGRFAYKDRCTFEIIVKLKDIEEEGTLGAKVWRVVKEGVHSKVCMSSRGDGTSTGENVESDTESTNQLSVSPPPVPRTFDSTKKYSTSTASPPSAKRMRLHSSEPSAQSSSSSTTSNLSSPAQSPSLSVGPSSTLSSSTIVSRPVVASELSSFLYTLSPPLSSHANLLHDLGINTTLSLMNLIISSKSDTLDLLLNRLEEGGEIKLVQRMAFRGKLKEVREAILASGR